MISEIKLDQSDLYANGSLLSFASGDVILNGNFIEYMPSERDKYHTVKKYDNLRSLAWQYYKDEKENAQLYWHYIAKANPIIVNPLYLDELVGVEIVIPDIINYELIYG